MFIRIADGTPELIDPDNFTAFHVEGGGLSAAALARALGDGALLVDDADDHLWLSAIGVVTLAGEHAAGEWVTKFDAMCTYAESKGWMNEPGTHIRAHIE